MAIKIDKIAAYYVLRFLYSAQSLTNQNGSDTFLRVNTARNLPNQKSGSVLVCFVVRIFCNSLPFFLTGYLLQI